MTDSNSEKGHRGKRLRARLRHVAFTSMPVRLSRGKLAQTRSLRSLCITNRNIILPALPDALDGIRIVHLSDLHVGELLSPDQLTQIIQRTNELQGDLVAVTGDFVDLSLGVLDQVIDALSHITAPMGVYFVPGNHDYLEDGKKLIHAFRHAKLNMLVNEQLDLDHQGTRVQVSGIDFAPKTEQLNQLVAQTLKQSSRRSTDLSLLLAHHPHAFDAAWRHGVNLTLSGHTHGGQLMLSNGRNGGTPFGLGNLSFKYLQGLYRRGNSYLYVTTGVGSWFPLRLKCQAEIACLTLRSQADPVEGLSHP